MTRRLEDNPAAELLPADPLSAIDLLAGLDTIERERVAKNCRLRRVRAGTRVLDDEAGIRAGDRAGNRPGNRDVLFVIEGRVRVIDETPGGRTVTYAEIAAGGLVGELAALDGGPRTAAVLAVTDCLVAMLRADLFIELLRLHPSVAIALLMRLVRVIREADRRISELSTIGAAGRLCRELLRRSRPGGDGEGMTRIVDPMPTQEQLASLTGATRETVARLLGQLQQAGMLRRLGHRLVITDPQRTAELAGLRDV
jgi:CRP/FNR family transcriptional regulator, cyclic AMP receptor protein